MVHIQNYNSPQPLNSSVPLGPNKAPKGPPGPTITALAPRRGHPVPLGPNKGPPKPPEWGGWILALEWGSGPTRSINAPLFFALLKTPEPPIRGALGDLW